MTLIIHICPYMESHIGISSLLVYLVQLSKCIISSRDEEDACEVGQILF